MPLYSEITFPIALSKSFTYEVPNDLKISIFSRVLVPFGSQKKVGIVTHLSSTPPSFKTKSILKVLDKAPLFSEIFFEWAHFISQYYMAPLGEVLNTALPSSLFTAKTDFELALKKSRSEALKDQWQNPKTIELTENQTIIFNQLSALASQKTFHAGLLHGVTGSGKTEIYLKLAKELAGQKLVGQKLASHGRQTLLLVPEIGLTPQMVGRFADFFGNALGLTHSGLTENQRLREWYRVQKGETQIIIGTRSALFLPFPNLGAIIIDEEHDPSYKQEERLCYHARDMALVRGKIEKCLVLMGSATPSLESLFHAHQGKYHYFHLPSRVATAKLPHVELIHMGRQKEQTGCPLALRGELMHASSRALQAQEQVLLLINRRGFAQAAYCNACNQMVTCKNCSVSQPYHRKTGKLLCHYCDSTQDLPKLCPQCKSPRMTLLGLGTETLEGELKTFFPHARVGRLDRDATQKKGSLLKILRDWKDHHLDILVGTQMIAKGHDIANVTLVGVVSADTGLNLPDFRAAERTFQLLMQVAGRSGRGEKSGRVIVQSYAPDHYSLKWAKAQDTASFYNQELEIRRELGYPPFGRLIHFRFSSGKKEILEKFSQTLVPFLERLKHTQKEVFFLGPAPSPLEKIRGQYRYGLLLKSLSRSFLRSQAREVMGFLEKSAPKTIKWAIDVDPVEMV
jgi:primosomal protein N' (replication factor Y)